MWVVVGGQEKEKRKEHLYVGTSQVQMAILQTALPGDMPEAVECKTLTRMNKVSRCKQEDHFFEST